MYTIIYKIEFHYISKQTWDNIQFELFVIVLFVEVVLSIESRRKKVIQLTTIHEVVKKTTTFKNNNK